MSNRPYPQFGVPLDPNVIVPTLPFVPLYGVTPDNNYIPIQVNNDGQLSIGNVTISGPVTVNDVVIKGVDPNNGNTSEDVSVNNLEGSNGYALRTSLFSANNSNSLLVNPDGSINVNIESGGSTPTIYNQYEENDTVPSGTPTTLWSYTVPNGETFELNGFVGWGTYNGEFLITHNDVTSGGGWSSAAVPTLVVGYGNSPIVCNAGDTISISVTHYSTQTQIFKVNALGTIVM